MIDFLFCLPNLITPGNPVTAQATERLATSGTIGLVVIAIIVVPVIIITITSLIDAPRTLRVPGLFIGSLVLLIGAIIFFMAIFGALLGFIVPQ